MISTEVHAMKTADGLINGMNMLMLTGTIANPDNRQLLLKKASQSKDFKELRIIRPKVVNYISKHRQKWKTKISSMKLRYV